MKILSKEEMWDLFPEEDSIEEPLSLIRYDDFDGASNVKDELEFNEGWYNYSKLTFDMNGKQYSVEYKEHTSDNVCDFEWLLDTFTEWGQIDELEKTLTMKDYLEMKAGYEAQLKEKEALISTVVSKSTELNKKLDRMEKLIAPFHIFTAKGLNYIGERFKEAYPDKDDASRVINSTGDFLIDLAKFKEENSSKK